MITQEYLGFFGSIYPSIIGMLIVFISLIFIAIYVVLVTKVIAYLEKNILSKKNQHTTINKTTDTQPVEKKDENKVKIAIITAAIAEELAAPIDSFVITDIKKIK